MWRDAGLLEKVAGEVVAVVQRNPVAREGVPAEADIVLTTDAGHHLVHPADGQPASWCQALRVGHCLHRHA